MGASNHAVKLDKLSCLWTGMLRRSRFGTPKIRSVDSLADPGTHSWPSKEENAVLIERDASGSPRSSQDQSQNGSSALNVLVRRPSIQAGSTSIRRAAVIAAAGHFPVDHQRGWYFRWPERFRSRSILTVSWGAYLHSNRKNSRWSGSARPSRRSDRIGTIRIGQPRQ